MSFSPLSCHHVGLFLCYIHQDPPHWPSQSLELHRCPTWALTTLLHFPHWRPQTRLLFLSHIPVQMPYFREFFSNHPMCWFHPSFHTKASLSLSLSWFLLSLLTCLRHPFTSRLTIWSPYYKTQGQYIKDVMVLLLSVPLRIVLEILTVYDKYVWNE